MLQTCEKLAWAAQTGRFFF
jgi:hypothetical protein